MEKSSIEVILDDEREKPLCPHGPTLLFRRFTKTANSGRCFFACSACRDRKECSFFQWADEKISDEKKAIRELHNLNQQPPYLNNDYYERFLKFKKLKPLQGKFCLTCGLILLPQDWPKHTGHQVICPISEEMLSHPTKLLKPLDNDKKEAQYFCTYKTTEFLISVIQKLGFQKLLCIGMPRLFELSKKVGLTALLLDIDHRYGQFWGDDFCCYNMFNHHFFEGASSKVIFDTFIQDENLLICIDPPFGGLLEVLAHTYKKISSQWQAAQKSEKLKTKDIPLMLLFPYFLETKIQQHFPSLRMLDYMVTYDIFQKKAQNSPIRVFTNIPLQKIILPGKDFRYCDSCQHYVAKTNRHCEKCGDCTSKSGQPYRHCDSCGHCVKDSWKHCKECNKCHLPDNHTIDMPCYVCSQIGHKRKDCPLIEMPRKRKKMKEEEQEELEEEEF